MIGPRISRKGPEMHCVAPAFSLEPVTVDMRLIKRVKVAMVLSCSSSFSGAGFEL